MSDFPGDGLQVTEERWGEGDGAELVAALLVDLERRYAGWEVDHDGPDDGADPTVAVRPAPVAAPVGDPAWAVDPLTVARPVGCFLVARRDGRPLGCAALRPLPGGTGGVAEVKRMYTVPAARGQGVARALLDRLVAVARELGYALVVLETGTGQPEALALYRSAGWVPVAGYGDYRHHRATRCFGHDVGATAD